jgi:cysteine desulfurase family protein (TIGR01976 family)
VAVTRASNALGTVPDVAAIGRAARAAGAWVFVDGVQAVPHLATDVAALECDFLACSAYKFFGPHVGVLWGRRAHLEALTPHKVRPAKDTIPHRWEQGTLNHEGLAGVAAAVAYLETLGDGATRRERLVAAMGAIQRYEQALGAPLIEGLGRLKSVRVYGLTDPGRLSERVPTVAFTVAGDTPRAVCERLAARGICAWSGDYYAVGVMERLGLAPTGGAVRVGLAHYNTAAEIEALLDALAP